MGEIGYTDVGGGGMDFNPKRKMVRDVEARRAEEEKVARERLEAEQKIAEAKRIEKERIRVQQAREAVLEEKRRKLEEKERKRRRKEVRQQTKAHRNPQGRKQDEALIQEMLEHVEGSVAQKNRVDKEQREKGKIKKTNIKELARRIAEDKEKRENVQSVREAEHQLQLLKDEGYDVEAMWEAWDRGLTFGTPEWNLFMAMRDGETSTVYDSDIPYKEGDLPDRADIQSAEIDKISDVDSDIVDPEEDPLENLPIQEGMRKTAEIGNGWRDSVHARRSGVKKPKQKLSEGESFYEKTVRKSKIRRIHDTKHEIKLMDFYLNSLNTQLLEDQEKTGGLNASVLQGDLNEYTAKKLLLEEKLKNLTGG